MQTFQQFVLVYRMNLHSSLNIACTGKGKGEGYESGIYIYINVLQI